MYQARETATGASVAERLRPAHTHWTRLKGLLGTRSLEPGDGLWIKPCQQVHMFGMRYAIDVVFLDEHHCVVGAVAGLAPGKISPNVRRATSVLELPEGTLARLGLQDGALITIDGGTLSGHSLPADGATQPRRVWARGACWVLGFILVTSLLVLLARCYLPSKAPGLEYTQFWAAGQLLAHGESPYDLALLAKTEKEYGWNKATDGFGYYDFMPHHYPPSLLSVVLAFLVPLGYPTFRMTWLVINTELLFLTGYMLRNALIGVRPLVPLLLIPLFGLSVVSVLVGQATALVLFLMAAAWRLLQRSWDRSAGAVLACVSIKPQVSLLLLMATLIWLTRQQRWQAIKVFVGVSLLFLATSLWWVPLWPLQIAQNLAEMPLAMGTDAFPWWGTTWLLLLRSLGLERWSLWTSYALLAVPFCWAALRCALRESSSIDEVFALSILATFFVTPTARIYDLPILLIPLLVLLGTRLPDLVGALLVVGLVVLPYLHLLRWIGSVQNIPVHVWFFWIPALLASLWVGSPFLRARDSRP